MYNEKTYLYKRNEVSNEGLKYIYVAKLRVVKKKIQGKDDQIENHYISQKL